MSRKENTKKSQEQVIINWNAISGTGLTIDRLNELGYEITGRQIPLGAKPIKHALLEIKNEDNLREVGFTCLYSIDDQAGLIIPRPFKTWMRNPLEAMIAGGK